MRSRSLAVWALLLLAAVSWAYLRHFDNGFAFDDAHTIVNNLFIRDISNIPRFFADAQTSSSLPENQAYRPVVTALNAIDFWRTRGLQPRAFHQSIFASFLLLGLLLFYFFRRIYQTASPSDSIELPALLAVGWFLLHTVNAETINYIIARSDSFSTLMVVLALVIYAAGTGWRRQLYLLPLCVGLMTKPTAAMLAPLLLLYSFLFEEGRGLTALFGRDGWRALGRSALRTAPAFVVGAALFAFTMKMTPSTYVAGTIGRIEYLSTQGFVVLHYFRQFLVPFGLTVDTDLKAFSGFGDPRAILGAAFVGLLVVASVDFSRRASLRPVTFGLLWFLIALGPTSSLVPLQEVLNYHRVFFPYIGLVLAGSWLLFLAQREIGHWTGWRGPTRIAAVTLWLIFFAAHAFGVRHRNEVWNDGVSLWADATAKSPRNGRAAMNYGVALMNRGRVGEADKVLTSALELLPRYSYLHVNLAVVKAAQGKHGEAETYFRNALSFGSHRPSSYTYYARWLLGRNRPHEAVPLARRAITLSPATTSGHLILMDALNRLERWQALLSAAQDTLRLDPNNQRARGYLERAQQRSRSPKDADVIGEA